MTGCVMAGLGTGGLIIPPTINWLITAHGWRNSFIIVGTIVIVIVVSAAQFLRRDPSQKGLAPYGANTGGGKDSSSGTEGFSLKEAVSTRQFLEMVYEETGHPVKIQAMPKLMLKGLALFMPMMRELDEMLYEFEEPFIVDHSKFEQTFGNHATPLREAIRTTVAWYRQNPKSV